MGIAEDNECVADLVEAVNKQLMEVIEAFSEISELEEVHTGTEGYDQSGDFGRSVQRDYLNGCSHIVSCDLHPITDDCYQATFRSHIFHTPGRLDKKDTTVRGYFIRDRQWVFTENRSRQVKDALVAQRMFDLLVCK